MERIFERFKRLGDHMTRSQGGTGLGLYIARQLARAIGGELSVRSAAGKGATFTLRLVAQEETGPRRFLAGSTTPGSDETTPHAPPG